MADTNDTRSLPELISGLASDISGLFRKEIQLAKAEASEKVSQTLGGVEMIMAGAVLGLGALGVLLSAIVTLLASFLVAQGMEEVFATTLAAFIVAVVVGIIAWAMIAKGRSNLKTSNLTLDRTTSSLARDADVVKERI
ncbi:phage holin family protein [Devosia sp. RR2S18]|jgi:O-antigen/teichoic acid export membrane protein|uniref:phage holin family protein n=1 Tax=Devosia rhizosphaerae TaxID=3049774 RepID=UPI00254055C6|nr:phage holin family protein [Devosia sp. RR2S18]WIJ24133.1 phage holin family protein [Devosia sp. RR2S18]